MRAPRRHGLLQRDRAGGPLSPSRRRKPCSSWRWLAAVVALAAGSACDDAPSTAPQGLLLVQPLRLDWTGKDEGVPFQSRGTWYAQANLRARWKFRLEARPADARDPRWQNAAERPLYTTEFSSQDRIWFTWNVTMVNPNRHGFAPGDTCTARVTLTPALDPSEETKSVFTFVIGG